MFGVMLVLIGIVWLLESMGILTVAMSQVVWPIVVIVLGVMLIFKKPWHRHHHWMGASDDCCKKTDETEKE